MLVKFENGVKDVEIVEVNKENYIVPENEKNVYHCKIEQMNFDSKTGKRLSKPRIQCFGKKMYETKIASHLPRQGYTVEILWNPNDYLKEVEEKEKQAAANAKAKAEAKMQAQIDAAVDAAIEKKESKKKSKKSEE